MMETDDAATPPPPSGPEAILEAIAREQALEQALEAAAAPVVDRVPYLGVHLGSQVYGLPLRQLREVCKLTRLRRVPGAPPGVAGLVNLRGEIVCALDVRAILGVEAPPPPEGAFLVALRGFPDPIGLVVDSIADIYAIDPSEIAPPPESWSAAHAAFFAGTVPVGDGIVGLLDVHRIVGASTDGGTAAGVTS